MRALPLLLAALLLAGCATPGPSSPASSSGAWSFTSFDGATHGPTDAGANATVLFFMATWCGTCRSKAPMLAETHEAYAERGVRFLSVDFDPSESEEAVKAWQEQYDHAWPHGLDEGRVVQRALSITSQSSVVVLDAEGHEIERFGYGQVTKGALTAALDEALAA